MNKLVRFLAFELQIQEETDLEGYMQKPGCPVPRYTATPQPQGAAEVREEGRAGMLEGPQGRPGSLDGAGGAETHWEPPHRPEASESRGDLCSSFLLGGAKKRA